MDNFNPHSREGSDHCIAYAAFDWEISIHTPAKGVTINAMQTKLLELISIHTPAKGVTVSMVYLSFRSSFQSTLPRRE